MGEAMKQRPQALSHDARSRCAFWPDPHSLAHVFAIAQSSWARMIRTFTFESLIEISWSATQEAFLGESS